MKVAVCVKQVPVVSMMRFDEETRRLVREGVPLEINYFDVLAMSLAADLKTALGCEVVVLTMGPPQARDALVQCMAMGADRAVHLVDRPFAGSDTLATARALSLALSRERPDLIVCGLNSVDAETGQVGPEIAELLDLPQITAVTRLEVSSSRSVITAERLTDAGHDLVHCALPALITVAEGAAHEVYPSREALQAAQSRDVSTLSAVDLSSDLTLFGAAGSPTRVSDIRAVVSERDGVLVRDTPVEETVERLLVYLEERGVFDEGEGRDGDIPPRGPRLTPSNPESVWVLAELMGGALRPVTFELLGAARALARRTGGGGEALLIGHGVGAHSATLTAYGADRIHLADDPRLAGYDTDLHTEVVRRLIEEHRPGVLLLPSTMMGRDLAARVAARMGLGLTGDCIGLEIDDQGRLVQLKPAFGGNIVAPILSGTKPQMATVRPGVLAGVSPDWSVEADVRTVAVGELPARRVRLLESVTYASAGGVEIEHARAVVGVGKGVGGPQNLPVIQDLADALDAPIGATRDVADLGWLPRQRQIGLSGKSIAPVLYVAVGLRGPFNHTVGIQKAGTVVAINSSARAPIFKSADFGIVGDYAEVAPALARALRSRRPRTSKDS